MFTTLRASLASSGTPRALKNRSTTRRALSVLVTTVTGFGRMTSQREGM
jgi:hypothetical protein